MIPTMMPRNYYIKTFFQFLLFALVSSCLSPITIETENAGGTLIISGQISPLVDRSSVQIGIASFDERLPTPVSSALVTLFDSECNIFSYNENQLTPGLYTLQNSTAIPGRTYHLEVILPDGSTYESVPEIMPAAIGTLSTSFDVIKEEFIDFEGVVSQLDFIKVYNDTQLPVESSLPVYLRWSVDEMFLLSPTDFPDPFGSIPPPCYVSQNSDPQRIVLFDGSSSSVKELKKQLIASRVIDFSFLERHYFTSYQSSLTKEAFEYWGKVNILANQVGSIFDTPPAKIKGNIRKANGSSEEVLGYFQAVNETYDRFFTLPFLLPRPLPTSIKKCDFTGSFNPLDYPNRCIDCLSVRNSSSTRPDWF